MTTRRQHGFSLVELMMAMTITLVVSAAIYGLLTSGANAFRREPELTERQQNIRVAMDLVARDVFNAGAGLPTYSQVFTITDPEGSCAGGLNGCGVPGSMGEAAAASRGSDAENTDVLELVAVDEQCPVLKVCNGAQLETVGAFVTHDGIPRCMRLPGLTLLTNDTSFMVRPAQSATAPAPCPGGNALQNGNFKLGVLPDAFRPAATGAANYLYAGRVVRYRIAPGLDPADPTLPSLWRSETGRYTATGLVAPEPGETGFPSADSPWVLVARGIEDLQIEYMDASCQKPPPDCVGLWQNRPPIVTSTPEALVRQVRITLSARTSAANLAGQTTAGGGAPNAVRGQLSTTVAPRAALIDLQKGN